MPNGFGQPPIDEIMPYCWRGRSGSGKAALCRLSGYARFRPDSRLTARTRGLGRGNGMSRRRGLHGRGSSIFCRPRVAPLPSPEMVEHDRDPVAAAGTCVLGMMEVPRDVRPEWQGPILCPPGPPRPTGLPAPAERLEGLRQPCRRRPGLKS